MAQLKVSDTSTAESGSELEEMASPKTNMNNHVPKLTPVSENVSVLMYKSDIENIEVFSSYTGLDMLLYLF